MEGRRPTGLLVLAIINFVFAGWAVVGTPLLLIIAFLKDTILEFLKERYEEGTVDEESYEQILELYASLPEGAALIVISVIGLIVPILLTFAAVGYLKQRKVMGRGIGNLYSLVALLNVALWIALGPKGMQFLLLFDIVYPVITLILLNTVFRDDFVN